MYQKIVFVLRNIFCAQLYFRVLSKYFIFKLSKKMTEKITFIEEFRS